MNSQNKRRLKKGAAATAIAVALIGGFEGVRLIAYRDVVGIPTVCFGETRGVKLGDHYTLDECKAMLGDALADFEGRMRACLKAPDAIPDKSYAAFLSLEYNIGPAAFCKSTVAYRINVGDLKGACNAMLAWNRAGGRVIAGLVKRRQEERQLCLEGAA
jgi:lysozyme